MREEVVRCQNQENVERTTIVSEMWTGLGEEGNGDKQGSWAREEAEVEGGMNE